MKKLFMIVFLISSLVLFGCQKKDISIDVQNLNNNKNIMSKQIVKAGDKVKVDYIGSLENGEIFDTSVASVAEKAGKKNMARNYEPLEFVVGAGQMIKGFDSGVVGMKIGETKKVSIEPADAYGEKSSEMIQKVPMDVFTNAGVKPNIGDIQYFGARGEYKGKIIEIGTGDVTIDFNHELAGKKLIFEITLKEIVK